MALIEENTSHVWAERRARARRVVGLVMCFVERETQGKRSSAYCRSRMGGICAQESSARHNDGTIASK